MDIKREKNKSLISLYQHALDVLTLADESKLPEVLDKVLLFLFKSRLSNEWITNARDPVTEEKLFLNILNLAILRLRRYKMLIINVRDFVELWRNDSLVWLTPNSRIIHSSIPIILSIVFERLLHECYPLSTVEMVLPLSKLLPYSFARFRKIGVAPTVLYVLIQLLMLDSCYASLNFVSCLNQSLQDLTISTKISSEVLNSESLSDLSSLCALLDTLVEFLALPQLEAWNKNNFKYRVFFTTEVLETLWKRQLYSFLSKKSIWNQLKFTLVKWLVETHQIVSVPSLLAYYPLLMASYDSYDCIKHQAHLSLKRVLLECPMEHPAWISRAFLYLRPGAAFFCASDSPLMVSLSFISLGSLSFLHQEFSDFSLFSTCLQLLQTNLFYFLTTAFTIFVDCLQYWGLYIFQTTLSLERSASDKSLNYTKRFLNFLCTFITSYHSIQDSDHVKKEISDTQYHNCNSFTSTKNHTFFSTLKTRRIENLCSALMDCLLVSLNTQKDAIYFRINEQEMTFLDELIQLVYLVIGHLPGSYDVNQVRMFLHKLVLGLFSLLKGRPSVSYALPECSSNDFVLITSCLQRLKKCFSHTNFQQSPKLWLETFLAIWEDCTELFFSPNISLNLELLDLLRILAPSSQDSSLSLICLMLQFSEQSQLAQKASLIFMQLDTLSLNYFGVGRELFLFFYSHLSAELTQVFSLTPCVLPEDEQEDIFQNLVRLNLSQNLSPEDLLLRNNINLDILLECLCFTVSLAFDKQTSLDSLMLLKPKTLPDESVFLVQLFSVTFLYLLRALGDSSELEDYQRKCCLNLEFSMFLILVSSFSKYLPSLSDSTLGFFNQLLVEVYQRTLGHFLQLIYSSSGNDEVVYQQFLINQSPSRSPTPLMRYRNWLINQHTLLSISSLSIISILSSLANNTRTYDFKVVSAVRHDVHLSLKDFANRLPQSQDAYLYQAANSLELPLITQDAHDMESYKHLFLNQMYKAICSKSYPYIPGLCILILHESLDAAFVTPFQLKGVNTRDSVAVVMKLIRATKERFNHRFRQSRFTEDGCCQKDLLAVKQLWILLAKLLHVAFDHIDCNRVTEPTLTKEALFNEIMQWLFEIMTRTIPSILTGRPKECFSFTHFLTYYFRFLFFNLKKQKKTLLLGEVLFRTALLGACDTQQPLPYYSETNDGLELQCFHLLNSYKLQRLSQSKECLKTDVSLSLKRTNDVLPNAFSCICLHFMIMSVVHPYPLISTHLETLVTIFQSFLVEGPIIVVYCSWRGLLQCLYLHSLEFSETHKEFVQHHSLQLCCVIEAQHQKLFQRDSYEKVFDSTAKLYRRRIERFYEMASLAKGLNTSAFLYPQLATYMNPCFTEINDTGLESILSENNPVHFFFDKPNLFAYFPNPVESVLFLFYHPSSHVQEATERMCQGLFTQPHLKDCLENSLLLHASSSRSLFSLPACLKSLAQLLVHPISLYRESAAQAFVLAFHMPLFHHKDTICVFEFVWTHVLRYINDMSCLIDKDSHTASDMSSTLSTFIEALRYLMLTAVTPHSHSVSTAGQHEKTLSGKETPFFLFGMLLTGIDQYPDHTIINHLILEVLYKFLQYTGDSLISRLPEKIPIILQSLAIVHKGASASVVINMGQVSDPGRSFREDVSDPAFQTAFLNLLTESVSEEMLQTMSVTFIEKLQSRKSLHLRETLLNFIILYYKNTPSLDHNAECADFLFQAIAPLVFHIEEPLRMLAGEALYVLSFYVSYESFNNLFNDQFHQQLLFTSTNQSDTHINEARSAWGSTLYKIFWARPELFSSGSVARIGLVSVSFILSQSRKCNGPSAWISLFEGIGIGITFSSAQPEHLTHLLKDLYKLLDSETPEDTSLVTESFFNMFDFCQREASESDLFKYFASPHSCQFSQQNIFNEDLSRCLACWWNHVLDRVCVKLSCRPFSSHLDLLARAALRISTQLEIKCSERFLNCLLKGLQQHDKASQNLILHNLRLEFINPYLKETSQVTYSCPPSHVVLLSNFNDFLNYLFSEINIWSQNIDFKEKEPYETSFLAEFWLTCAAVIRLVDSGNSQYRSPEHFLTFIKTWIDSVIPFEPDMYTALASLIDFYAKVNSSFPLVEISKNPYAYSFCGKVISKLCICSTSIIGEMVPSHPSALYVSLLQTHYALLSAHLNEVHSHTHHPYIAFLLKHVSESIKPYQSAVQNLCDYCTKHRHLYRQTVSILDCLEGILDAYKK